MSYQEFVTMFVQQHKITTDNIGGQTITAIENYQIPNLRDKINLLAIELANDDQSTVESLRESSLHYFETESHYAYNGWWYTSSDSNTNYDVDAMTVDNYDYGFINFCEGFDNSGTVETWKELLEYYYDPSNTISKDTF